MMNFKKTLDEHIKRYPKMSSDDAVKAAYQSVFGASHFCAPPDEAEAAIEDEMRLFPECADCPASIPVGEYFRLELKNPAVRRLGAAVISKMFCLSASGDKTGEASREALTEFAKRLAEIEEYVRCGKLCPGRLDINGIIKEEKTSAPSHSEEYKRLYLPSYRVISNKYLPLLPLMLKIGGALSAGGRCAVAVDGGCASGKTTAGRFLSFVFGAPCISMDSFFLPPDRKNPGRLSEIGGNTDHERFAAEVAPFLKSGKPFSYGVYNCHDGSTEKRFVPASRLIIVEGVYTMREEFEDLYDVKVFCEASEDERNARLMKRSPALFNRYREEWIPMENKYFSSLKIKEKCDIILHT